MGVKLLTFGFVGYDIYLKKNGWRKDGYSPFI